MATRQKIDWVRGGPDETILSQRAKTKLLELQLAKTANSREL